MSGRIIVVDWGTTSFRAWLVEADGRIVDEVPDGPGMRALARGQFAAVCAERLAPWAEEDAPIYLAGMVGAPQGWQTAPQPALPASLDTLADNLVAVDDLPNAYIVPGLRLEDADSGDIDIMRGEEVQIFGALALTAKRDGLLCLPGTHSKWAWVEDGVLRRFASSMTGEVFEVMLGHSILGLTARRGGAFDAAAFDAGLDQAATAGGLLHHLFTARTRGLYGGLAPEAVESYLSGVLIGTEIWAMRGLFPRARVLLVCAEHLRGPYERALDRAGLTCLFLGGREATIRGVLEVARKTTEM